MSRFGADPLAFFNAVYRELPPWEIGGPQPAMAALLARHPPASPVLDVGCGSGDLALYLAQQGCQVLGIDFVAPAIAAAQAKADTLPADVARLVDFQVADALAPSRLGRQFGAVVDSGFLHLLDSEQSDLYSAELAAALRPGGRYYLHAFAVEFPVPNVPRSVDANEIQARFSAANGWRILDLYAGEFLSRVAPPVPATCACIERIADFTQGL